MRDGKTAMWGVCVCERERENLFIYFYIIIKLDSLWGAGLDPW